MAAVSKKKAAREAAAAKKPVAKKKAPVKKEIGTETSDQAAAEAAVAGLDAALDTLEHLVEKVSPRRRS